MRKIPKLGRGKNISIAKAALIFYFEECNFFKSHGEKAFLNYGDLDSMHRIVDIAGANHCSFFTATQVSSCLANSPYWDKEFIPGFYFGFKGHGGANIFTPSEKGKEYYKKKLKNHEYRTVNK